MKMFEENVLKPTVTIIFKAIFTFIPNIQVEFYE